MSELSIIVDNEIKKIVDDAFNHWISPDGQMGLAEDNFVYDSVDNQNGILFIAYFWMLLRGKHSALMNAYSVFARHSLTVIRKSEALYYRSTLNVNELNSIDNYDGIVAIATLFGFEDVLKEVVSYGEANNWVFNHNNPGKFKWMAWRQPSERCYYKVCLGNKEPTRIELMWFVAGSLITTYFNGFKKHSSNHLRHWLRLKAISFAPPSKYDNWFKWLEELHKSRVMNGPGGIDSVFAIYFWQTTKNPIRRLAAGLDY